MYHSGTLDIRYGPMYAKKSCWLNGNLNDYSNKGLSVAKIVHPDDSKRNNVKFNDESGSSNYIEYKSLSDKVVIISVDNISDAMSQIDEFDVIGVDEFQFFEGKVSDFIKILVSDKKKRVLATGLDGDYNREKWGELLDLIPFSDSSEKFTATCELCLQELKQINFKGNVDMIKAPFTKRLVDSKEQKLVGGKNEYIPVCRYHYDL